MQLNLHSIDEPKRFVQPSPVKVEVFEPLAVETEEHPPLDEMVRSVYIARGYSGLELEEQIRNAENELARRGGDLRRATWQAGNIGALAFTPREIQDMTLDEKRRWLSLLARHLRSCRAAILAIENILATESEERSGGAQSTLPAIGNLAELRRSVASLSRTGEHLDRLLVAGFTLSPNRPTVVLKPGELEPLVTELDHEESSLSRTVERLRMSTQGTE
jgi:hypothetical protein